MPGRFPLGRFELTTRRAQLRTGIGAIPLIGIGGPVLCGLGRFGRPTDLHRAERTWAGQVIRHLHIETDIAGAEHVESGRSYIVAPLHEGFLDAVVLMRLGLDLRFVASDELFEWPRLGRYLEATKQFVMSTPPSIGGQRALIRGVGEALQRGESVVMFPQASILGVEVAFKPGPARIAQRFETPILPVVITGTHRVWEHPYSNRLRYGQRVSARILAPIEPVDAIERWRATERKMKSIAMQTTWAPVRRFVPSRDGWWDGYDYQIDPDFEALANEIAGHRRAAVAAGSDIQTRDVNLRAST